MNADANIAAVAALMADPARSVILLALLDGRALTATELARRARISPSTASAHLTKLVEGGLLSVERQGRHRYFRLANQEIAQVLETLLAVAPPAPVRSLREAQTGEAIHFARTCYDHLAGALGVQLAQSLVTVGSLVKEDTTYAVTPVGAAHLERFGLDLAALRRQRRAFAPCCLDWSERRHHVAGALGAALAGRCFELGWFRRMESSRAVFVTEAGRTGLRDVFGMELRAAGVCHVT